MAKQGFFEHAGSGDSCSGTQGYRILMRGEKRRLTFMKDHLSVLPLFLSFLLLGFFCPSVVYAEWRGSVTFATDYPYRGYSKSNGNPVFQGNLEYEHELGGFGGLSISQVRFDDKNFADRSSVELRPYVGWAFRLSEDWRSELSASYYLFDGRAFGRPADYVEVYGSLHFRNSFTAQVAVAPDAYGQRADTLHYELQWRRDLTDTLRVSGALGYFQTGSLHDPEYFHWNAGFTWYPVKSLAADLRYVDIQSHGDNSSDGFEFRDLRLPLVFSLTYGF